MTNNELLPVGIGHSIHGISGESVDYKIWFKTKRVLDEYSLKLILMVIRGILDDNTYKFTSKEIGEHLKKEEEEFLNSLKNKKV